MSIIGKLTYKYFFQPFVQPLKSFKDDGYFYGRYFLKKGVREMKIASVNIRFECSKTETDIPFVHFLTGKNYWYQTIFCAYSLYKNTSLPIHFVFHDDGSFDDIFIAQILMQVKNCTVDTKLQTDIRLNQSLPVDKFPYLRKFREHTPMFYKLTDCRIGYNGWNLYLDSDMIFLNRPLELEQWLLKPDSNLYMRDKYCSYQYSFELLKKILNEPIKGFINAGLLGINNNQINWKEVEEWAKQLIDNEGVNFFYEQTLYAMYITKYGGKCPDENLYFLLPSKKNILNSEGILHHYPTGNRQWYLRYGWRKILKEHPI